MATLLTGHPIAATRVIATVVGAQPDLRQLDSAHLDRLTVLRSREIPSGTLVGAGVDPAFAEALAGLDVQAREAWIFSRVYQMAERDSARAMDCSTTAGATHLDRADAVLAAIGDTASFARSLRAYSSCLTIPAFYRDDQRDRLRRRRALQAAGLVLLGVSILILAWIWHRTSNGG